jgi:hypothetical protein
MSTLRLLDIYVLFAHMWHLYMGSQAGPNARPNNSNHLPSCFLTEPCQNQPARNFSSLQLITKSISLSAIKSSHFSCCDDGGGGS